MSIRRLFAGVATTSVVAASMALIAPAHADPATTPVAGDIVGVGSDTSMFALNYLANGNGGVAGYNAGKAAGSQLVSFDAKTVDAAGTQTNSATVVLRAGSAAITRPNGSGAGKALLYAPNNNVDVNFARSSAGLSPAEASGGLVAFPFAKDTLAMAVAQTTNAPVGLTEAQIVGIYKGEITNWSAVGGTDGVIKPLIPQAGSGTRSFFEGELKRMNAGTTVVLAPSVVPVQEHDDSPVKGDANAIAPFSVGRAGLLGTLRIETGFSATRALYNVVRQPDVASTWAQGIFGPTGFVCSPAATSLILDAGFEQLLSQANGGKCGVSTTSSTAVSDLLTAKVSTTTTVAGTSATAGALALTATVGGGGQLKPQGTVAFSVDGAAKGNAIVTGGKAAFNLTGLTAGDHKVVATFTPTGAAFSGSASAETVVNVKATTPVPAAKAKTKIVEKFKPSYEMAKSYKGKIILKESATGAPTGKVVVKLGKKTVGKGKIKAGKVTLTVKKLKLGKNKLTATFAGNSAFAGSKLKFTITVK